MRATLGKLEVALGATQDSIAWTDEHGRIEWCNAPFDRLAGRPHMAVIGQEITKALPIDQWAAQGRPHPAKTVLSSRSFLTETIETRRDGRQQFLEFFGSWAQGGGIAPIAVFVVRDVTARRQREEQLSRTSAVLEALQETALDGLLIVNEKGRILACNSRLAQMWRIPEDVLATRSEDGVLKSMLGLVADPEGFLERVQALYCDREATRREEIALVDQRVFDRYSAPIVGANGAYYGRAWYFRDVTQARQADKALAEKTRELARSNAELQQFASAASHDLLEPLRKIGAFGDLLQRRAGDKLDEPGREFLARMQSAASRMAKLIDDLLQFSRVYGNTRPFERVDLGQVAREVAEDLEPALSESGGSIELGELPVVEAHAYQMRQLIQNLVANSIKFRQPAVPLRLALSSRPAAKKGFVEIVVEDNGIGFEEQYAEKIFQPFLRLHTRQEYSGTGLGLAICRRIVTRHGGWIVGRGAPNTGATFTVTLPSGRKP